MDGLLFFLWWILLVMDWIIPENSLRGLRTSKLNIVKPYEFRVITITSSTHPFNGDLPGAPNHSGPQHILRFQRGDLGDLGDPGWQWKSPRFRKTTCSFCRTSGKITWKSQDFMWLDHTWSAFSTFFNEMTWKFQLQWENPWKSGCLTEENHPFSLDAAPFRWRGQGGSPALRSSGWPKAHRSLSHGPPVFIEGYQSQEALCFIMICQFVIDLSLIYHDLSHPALYTPLSKGTIVVICCQHFWFVGFVETPSLVNLQKSWAPRLRTAAAWQPRDDARKC